MAKCAACGKFLSPSGAATCSTCPCLFHKGCVAIPDYTATPKEWICPECKKKQRRSDNRDTPLKNVSGTTSPATSGTVASVLVAESELPLPAMNVSLKTVNLDVREMRRELAEYMAELRVFRNELRVSIANVGERLDGFERRLVAVEQRELLSPKLDEVTELQHTVSQLKQDLNEREQEILMSDLDIGQLPEEKGESVHHKISILAAKLGITLEDRDILFAERVGARTEDSGNDTVGRRSRRVIVRLARPQLRNDLLHAARVRRHINTADIGLSGPPCRLYINERLTRANRQLFRRVREECRRRHWRYSWTKRGHIFAREGDGKQVHLIRSEDNFNSVFGTGTV